MTEFAPEPAAPELAEPAQPEVPAEESWQGPSQEDWESTQQALNYLANAVAPPQQQQQGYEPPAPVQLDPLDENFQQALDQYLDQKLAPYADYTQQAILGEAEQRASDILSDITSRDGEFLFEGSVEKARALANSYVGQMSQQYGFGPQAAEQAIEQAAKDVRAWEQSVGQAYHERQMNQLSTLGGARQEPGAAGAGAQQFVIPEGGDLFDVVRRHTGT